MCRFYRSHLCERLLEENYEVVGIDNFDDFYSRDLKERNIKSFRNNTSFELHEFDLLNQDKLNELEAIDVVIHLAAKRVFALLSFALLYILIVILNQHKMCLIFW